MDTNSIIYTIGTKLDFKKEELDQKGLWIQP
jgi:hypothetical protein